MRPTGKPGPPIGPGDPWGQALPESDRRGSDVAAALPVRATTVAAASTPSPAANSRKTGGESRHRKSTAKRRAPPPFRNGPMSQRYQPMLPGAPEHGEVTDPDGDRKQSVQIRVDRKTRRFRPEQLAHLVKPEEQRSSKNQIVNPARQDHGEQKSHRVGGAAISQPGNFERPGYTGNLHCVVAAR